MRRTFVDAVLGHECRILLVASLEEGHVQVARVHSQLLHGSGPEGVASSDLLTQKQTSGTSKSSPRAHTRVVEKATMGRGTVVSDLKSSIVLIHMNCRRKCSSCTHRCKRKEKLLLQTLRGGWDVP